jgi:hypothetical protein
VVDRQQPSVGAHFDRRRVLATCFYLVVRLSVLLSVLATYFYLRVRLLVQGTFLLVLG